MDTPKDLLCSSPDPLGLSDENMSSPSPTKKQRSSITPRKALTNGSSNTQIQEFYLTTPPALPRYPSPRKTSHHKEQPESPWRIRLTVQAERIDDPYAGGSQMRLSERTTTTRVPLKGGDDQSPVVKRGRGRPRKSLDGPVKRNGTPKPKAAGRRKTMLDSPGVTKEKTSRTSVSIKETNARVRKSMESGLEMPNTGNGSGLSSSPDLASTPENRRENMATRPKKRGKGKEITPMKPTGGPETDNQSIVSTTELDELQSAAFVDDFDVSKGPTSRPLENVSPEYASGHIELSTERSTQDIEDEDMWRSMIHQDSRCPELDIDAPSNSPDLDPTEEHQDFDTILESEGFSMVSISSLPSAGNQSNSLAERSVQPQSIQESQNVQSSLSSSALRAPSYNYPSVGASSSQRISTSHERPSLLWGPTPDIARSPSAPPAIEVARPSSSPRQVDKVIEGTPKIARVTRAGSALQSLVSPVDSSSRLRSPQDVSVKSFKTLGAGKQVAEAEDSPQTLTENPPANLVKNAYPGFGVGTRRELRAGLRLGEELAKRQAKQQRTSDEPQLPNQNISAPQTLYPVLPKNQLPSPETSVKDAGEDRMDWKATTPIKVENPALPVTQLLVYEPATLSDVTFVDYSMLAREGEWQREREAISKQIDEAPSSQVILIDSDEEEYAAESDEADNDIWQEQVRPAKASQSDIDDSSNQLPQLNVIVPRRSKLPSPWRRSSQVVYSDEVDPTKSDLFWQPDQAQTQAAKKRKERKRRAENSMNSSALSDMNNSSSSEVRRSKLTTVTYPVLKVSPWEKPVEESPQAILETHDSSLNSTQLAPEDFSVSKNDSNVLEESPFAAIPERSSNVKLGFSRNVKGESRQVISKTTVRCPELVEPEIKDKTRDYVQPTQEVLDGETLESPSIQRTNLFESSQGEPHIDPHLIQEPQSPLTQPQLSSWLSVLTAPITRLFTPSAPTLPPATESDILSSSPHEPLPLHLPWRGRHRRALEPLYYASHCYGAYIFPYNPRSPSAQYLGDTITTPLGWSRKITKADCGVADAYMVLLRSRGVFEARMSNAPPEMDIDEGVILSSCVESWVHMVMRGEVAVDAGRGEVVGRRRRGDRLWRVGDVEWAENQSRYFERKKREFEGSGLPSWRAKGLM